MFQTKLVEKIKKACYIQELVPKIELCIRKCGKYIARQATDDSKMWRMRFAC